MVKVGKGKQPLLQVLSFNGYVPAVLVLKDDSPEVDLFHFEVISGGDGNFRSRHLNPRDMRVHINLTVSQAP